MSRQLGRKDTPITLRVYAHWVQDGSTVKVDLLDDAQQCQTVQAHVGE
jgi:hypothetical protein